MCRHRLKVRAARSVGWLIAILSCPVAWGGELFRGSQQVSPDPNAESVELFAAVRGGRVEAKLTAFNSKQARLQLVNKTGQPLTILLPTAFGAVPVLAQIGNNGFPNNNNNNNNQLRAHKATQTLGLGAPGLAGGANGGGPGLFNVANKQGGNQNRAGLRPFFNLEPEKVGQINLRAVCLEHGKPSPKPRVAYEIRPLEEISTKPGVSELCRLLRDPDVDLQALQAATWHVVNGVSWERLGHSRYAAPLPQADALFSARELREGKDLAERVLQQTEERNKAGGKLAPVKIGYNAGLGPFMTRPQLEPWRQFASNIE